MKRSQRRGRVQESKCRSKEAQEAGPRGVSNPRSGGDSGQCPRLRPTTWLYPEQQVGHHRLCGEQAREQLSPELLTLLAPIKPLPLRKGAWAAWNDPKSIIHLNQIVANL